MGTRFRKSINLGPFRINLSKSGIGYSYGVKGLRYTKTANGRNRVTTTIPGTGFSHVSETSSRRPKAKMTTRNNSTTNQQGRQELMQKYNLSERKMLRLERDARLHHDKFVRLSQNEQKLDRYIRRHYGFNLWKWILYIIAFVIIFAFLNR